ncbi:MAG: 2-C-methyl-D-erythritol 2,4-cyclodiphosphate synthase [Gammaproteobacteria bacterium]|nr:2-C-methyl-D-erythritol 2,4-cyclodiphosphate synthase [Gammaproteobacteria bacterium]MDE0512380.1 2-C-methyl-D-erythritol 2,4-cyclodiphosphate synthase [Gammaproteobacteria bacterium]
MRIGHGYDTHRFVEGRPLVLGGVNVPHDKGLLAHSDGDVVIHALCDALLGAAALGDIGAHFPDTSADFKNIDSRVLLRRVQALLLQNSHEVINADITIIAEEPKMAPHIDVMRDNLCADLDVTRDAINIKATTNEKMGFIGNREGIAVHAVALIR